VGHAGIEPGSKRGNGVGFARMLEVPGPLPDDRNRLAERTETDGSHEPASVDPSDILEVISSEHIGGIQRLELARADIAESSERQEALTTVLSHSWLCRMKPDFTDAG
jgi:hypothetical protein